MSYTVENLEKSMVKLTITVDPETFDKAVNQAYQKNKGKIVLQGFRKGKAPRKIIEKMYGEGVFYEDAANIAIPEAYEEAAKDSKLEIVARPEIDIVEIGRDKGLVFTATVAVKPEVTLGDYKGLEVAKQEVKIMAADVNAEIDKVREQNSRMEVVERAVKNGDFVTIDFVGYKDGEKFEGGEGNDYPLEIGSHSFVDTFEDQLVGKKTGDEVEVNVTFPEEYHAKDLAGQPVVFQVTIKEVKEKQLPKADDEFASEVSEFETLKDYKASIKKDLTEKAKAAAKTSIENEAVEKAAANATMEIPEPMILEQINQMMNEFASRLAQQGLNFEQYMQLTGNTVEKMQEELKPEAIRRIETRLVLEAIVKAENITASDAEVDEEISKMADMYQMDVDKIKEIMGAEEREQMAVDIAVQKAVDFLVKEAKEVEVAEEEATEE